MAMIGRHTVNEGLGKLIDPERRQCDCTCTQADGSLLEVRL
jgi:hypothetical protein